MPQPLTVRSLYDAMRTGLDLEWLAGKRGANRTIKRDLARRGGPSLLGHLNLIHANQVQVVGKRELEYLKRLHGEARADSLEQLFNGDALAVIIAGQREVPEDLIRLGDERNTPILRSPRPSHEIINILRYFFTNKLAEQTTIHGVFMEVLGIGVLLAGDSNVGKSELALDLITRGHRLVADDAPEFARIAPDILQGSCPNLLSGFLEVRGLGVLNIRSMYGDNATKASKYLRLIINLRHFRELDLDAIDRLHGDIRSRDILGIDIPEITLPVAPGRNLAVLVEAAVRNHLLRMNGYNAGEDFARQQQELIDQQQ